jgi:hypothetical protein
VVYNDCTSSKYIVVVAERAKRCYLQLVPCILTHNMYVRRREIPLLEEKVRVLMAKLDLAPKTATGVRGGSGDTSDDAVGGGGDGEVGSGEAVAGAIAGEEVGTKG